MRSHKIKTNNIVFCIFIIFLTIMLLFCADRCLTPKLKEISHLQCQSTMNQIIDLSAKNVMQELKPAESVLIPSYTDGKGYMANTMYINSLCTRFSEEITRQMTHLSAEQILIPMGAVTDLSFLADKGPDIPFSLLPVGAAKVDYASDFQSVGINQINYKIWLIIKLEMKIANPLYQETIHMERKIMLADIVFSGKVPEHFFQINTPSEYLLTE